MEKKIKRQTELIIGILLVLFAIEQWISPFIMPRVGTLAGWLIFIIFLLGAYFISRYVGWYKFGK